MGNLYNEITESIIKELETGVAPWIKPWKVQMPYNAVTKRRYSGINVLLLWKANYASPEWFTFQQAKHNGVRIKKGEHATRIVKVGTYSVKKENEAEEEREYTYLKPIYVFNAEQTEGYDEKAVESLDGELFINQIPAKVHMGGQHAYYHPREDSIYLPHPEHFENADHFLATKAHELVHWSGAEHRLKREFGKRFGDQAYCQEELVAELGSAFLCSDLGIKTHLRHAEYIGSWVKFLGEHRKAILSAAAHATNAAAYLKQATVGGL